MTDVTSPVSPVTAPDQKMKSRRRSLLLALATVVALGAAAWATTAFVISANIESTDDAYVSGDVVQVTSEAPGNVIGLHADDTQRVKAGDTLIELDPADAKISMSAAEAGLAQAVRGVKALLAQADQLRAQIAAREADVERAQDDAKRRAALIATGAISREDFAHARDNSAEQAAGLVAARAELDQVLTRIGNTPVAFHPDVLSTAAKLRSAALALRRTNIVAPADGIVAKRSVQVGQHVDSGSPLMAVVPLDNVWIDANFKEVQLQRMRVGQKARITSDIYGGKIVYRGTVAGFAAGSGNAFALLPSQNATGNWIKIVQRVPVRVLVDAADLKAHPLRVGLSTVVDVDVADGEGPLVSSEVRNQPFSRKNSAGDDPAVSALIAKIIADNGGADQMAATGVR